MPPEATYAAERPSTRMLPARFRSIDAQVNIIQAEIEREVERLRLSFGAKITGAMHRNGAIQTRKRRFFSCQFKAEMKRLESRFLKDDISVETAPDIIFSRRQRDRSTDMRAAQNGNRISLVVLHVAPRH